MSWLRLKAIVKKEFLHMFRDVNTLRMMIMMPVLMIFLFGYVASTDVDEVGTAVAIQDTGVPAMELLEKFSATNYFRIVRHVDSPEQAGELIQSGEVKAAIIIPSDYSLRLDQGLPAQVQVLIDGSDPAISREALSTAEMLGQVVGNEVRVKRLGRDGVAGQDEALVDVRPRVWYNPDMDSIKFNLPGLIGMILQNVTVVSIAFAMVREREYGTIEQLVVTPVKPAELVIGKMIPYTVMGIVDSLLVVLLSMIVFGLEIAGSMSVLAINCFFFLIGSLGLGILFSTLARNQAQANQMAQMFLLPSVMLSGFFFPREAMPRALYLIGELIPLTHLLVALRGVILKASGMQVLWPQATALLVYAVLMMTVASLRFRRKLD